MDIDRVQVFSATKHRDRAALGERVTDWLKEYPGQVSDTIIRQSSDQEFHCLTIVLLCKDVVKEGNGRKTRRTR